MKRHRHVYERIRANAYEPSRFARCTVCGIQTPLEDLVYLGDAPRSVGPGYLGGIVGR